MRKWIAGSILLVVAAAATWLWSPLPPPPNMAGWAEKANEYDVEVIRDQWGVPHVFGKRDADTAFGLGYAHAEDDLENIQLTLAVSRGQLARYKGKAAAPTDYLIALLGVWDTVNEGYDVKLPGAARELAEAYADGLNAYVAQHPEEAWQGLFPASGKDIAAGFVFKTPLFYGLDQTLLQLFEGAPKSELAWESQDSERLAWTVGPRSGTETGSNAFAVAPARSADGKTRLVVNSHQPFTGPVAWYEIHLHSEEGLDIWGGTFPGAPLVLHGFNRHLGWANTVNKPDLIDVYRLTINPENEQQYLLDGQWQDFTVSDVNIEVRLFGPFAFTAHRQILSSLHGPVIEGPDGIFAVRYAGRGELRQLEQYRRLNKAENLEEWLNAMRMLAAPSINYVYADEKGNVGLVYNAQFPDRQDGPDWENTLPGDQSKLIWNGYRPFERVPKIFNPESGFVFNANNTPYLATDGGDNLNAASFPVSMGLETRQTNRSLRLFELAKETPSISREDLLRIKFDTRYSVNSLAAAAQHTIAAHDFGSDQALTDAAGFLGEWDLETNASNRHTALGVLTIYPTIRAGLMGQPTPNLIDSFAAAVEFLVSTHDRIDPEWQELNVLRRGNKEWAVDGGPDTVRAIYGSLEDDTGKIIANAGDTLISITEWAADGTMSAASIHQFGSATTHMNNPHFADQAPLFSNEQLKPVLLEKDEIVQHASRRYRPGINAGN